jgi:excisionase family DNA binding protein
LQNPAQLVDDGWGVRSTSGYLTGKVCNPVGVLAFLAKLVATRGARASVWRIAWPFSRAGGQSQYEGLRRRTTPTLSDSEVVGRSGGVAGHNRDSTKSEAALPDTQARVRNHPGAHTCEMDRIVSATFVQVLLDALDGDALDALAERLAPRLAKPAQPDGWLTVTEAAEYLRCPKSRVYSLVSARRIPFVKDGSRTLFRRSELDSWLLAGGGKRP